eukprot:3708931-Amphidinium_carterae.1
MSHHVNVSRLASVRCHMVTWVFWFLLRLPPAPAQRALCYAIGIQQDWGDKARSDMSMFPKPPIAQWGIRWSCSRGSAVSPWSGVDPRQSRFESGYMHEA